jgi:hypothetical protein
VAEPIVATDVLVLDQKPPLTVFPNEMVLPEQSEPGPEIVEGDNVMVIDLVTKQPDGKE